MRESKAIRWTGLSLVALLCITVTVVALLVYKPVVASPLAQTGSEGLAEVMAPAGSYVILAQNDLGMHCYNRDFQYLGVLPPANTLVAQVVRVGDPPQIITSGITVSYTFPDNTDSVSKSNFWSYAQQLFGLTVPLPSNIGLAGKGLAGDMDLRGDHFVAEWIPLTEFRDSAPTVPYPYQLALIIACDATTGAELARQTVVAPVSTEMHCDTCHGDHGRANRDIATGVVELNILTLHDRENMDDYPAGHRGSLVGRVPILCAECHASNALRAPGAGDMPNFSRAMHDKHKEIVPSTLDGCYNCHPGPQTQCLRDVMSQQHGMTCVDCHGTMSQVARNPNPWLNEPRCASAGCHGAAYQQNAALYRLSTGHGGLFCAACHDSPHAIAQSREPNDAIKFIALQGHAGTLRECSICHATQPSGPGPHGLLAPTATATSVTPVTETPTPAAATSTPTSGVSPLPSNTPTPHATENLTPTLSPTVEGTEEATPTPQETPSVTPTASPVPRVNAIWLPLVLEHDLPTE
jgi:hypothetical protein